MRQASASYSESGPLEPRGSTLTCRRRPTGALGLRSFLASSQYGSRTSCCFVHAGLSPAEHQAAPQMEEVPLGATVVG